MIVDLDEGVLDDVVIVGLKERFLEEGVIVGLDEGVLVKGVIVGFKEGALKEGVIVGLEEGVLEDGVFVGLEEGGSCASSGALVGEVESGVTKLLGFLHKGDCAGTHCPLVLLHTAPGSQHLADALQ